VCCCQVEVSATSRSLVQRSPTDCGVSLSVIKRNYKPRHWKGKTGVGRRGGLKNKVFVCDAVFSGVWFPTFRRIVVPLSWPWKWRQHDNLKRRGPLTQRHGVISQKTRIFIDYQQHKSWGFREPKIHTVVLRFMTPCCNMVNEERCFGGTHCFRLHG
jgi:hypothetical protein